MIDTYGFAPWSAEPVNDVLTASDLTLLRRIYTGHFGEGRGVVYSEPGRRSPTQRLMRSLHALGVVEFMDEHAGGWDRGMWGARLTCLGANAAFRDEHRSGTYLDGHPGCEGGWLPDGTCTGCSQRRPLDRAAYDAYLDALDTDARIEQERGPQLYCIEHGYLRRRDITTTKVCRQPGTVFHDGGLMRV